TPVAVLMFRYNNPDSLLVLLLVGSAYALTRALEGGRTRWLVLAGVLVGFGFLTKMMGAFLVLPGFPAVYLLAAHPAAAGGRCRDAGLGRLVGGDGHALAGRRPPLHRGLDRQQRAQPHLRL